MYIWCVWIFNRPLIAVLARGCTRYDLIALVVSKSNIYYLRTDRTFFVVNFCGFLQ